jgi:hypothetical protein
MERPRTADRYLHEAGSTDVLMSGEEDDRVMTGGLHSVGSAGCHSLVDSAAWVPIEVQNRDRGLRTQQREQPGVRWGLSKLGTLLRAW